MFETVLVRTVNPPEAVFDRVGRAAVERGLVTCSAYAFGRQRERAQRRAAHVLGEATTLAAIYDRLAEMLGLTADRRDALEALELETEAAVLRPVPGAAEWLSHVRRTSRVAFVSDMYLPTAFVAGQLKRWDLSTPRDAVYVSGELGRSKRRGGLLRLVAAREGVSVDQLTHYGNCHNGDVLSARRDGAVGVWTPAAEPNRYEEALGRHSHATDGATAALSGASRLARLAAGEDRSEIAAVAAGVAAPFHIAFVLWVLRRAEVLGLRRLYFVARDGQRFLHVARRLVEALGLDIDLRYLYASRGAWNPCAAPGSQAWKSLLDDGGNDPFSNREILARTGAADDDLEAAIRATGASVDAWESRRDRTPVWAAFDALVASGAIERAAADRRQLLSRYLDTEGLFDDVPHALVDVGWRGTQHGILCALQAERGVELARGLFAGLAHHAQPHPWFGRCEGYLFDVEDTALTFPDIANVIEALCLTDHGPLVGYDASARPVLACETRPDLEAWGLRTFLDTIDRVLAHAEDAFVLGVDLRPAVADVLAMFGAAPTVAEARVWGALPWEESAAGSVDTVPFALRHRVAAGLAQTVGARLRGRRSSSRPRWLGGTLRLSSPQARFLLTRRDTLRRWWGVARGGLAAVRRLARRAAWRWRPPKPEALRHASTL